jgi:predicted metal-dependent HD superfamily phosphohydrolase
MFDCRHRPLALPGPLVAQLASAYGEPHRAYHDARHVDEVLTWFDRVADDVGWHRPAEVYLAIVFHDAIYQPGAQDNEARSAAWARSAALGDVDVDRARVAELIELTARHGHVDRADRDAELFLDSDMAILGAPPAVFDAYDTAIALEYQHVPADAYRAGRRAFLAGLLGKSRIFLTDYFHARLDARARANLSRALAALA